MKNLKRRLTLTPNSIQDNIRARALRTLPQSNFLDTVVAVAVMILSPN